MAGQNLSLFPKEVREKLRTRHGAPELKICAICKTVFAPGMGHRKGCSPACSAEIAFWEHVEKTETCWIWRGYLQNGYGYFAAGETRKWTRASGYAYRLLVGPVPDGLVLDHLCKNPPCVNPAHLEPVTQQINVLRSEGRAAKNAGKTHCPAGHEYTPENTYISKQRTRGCVICRRQRSQEWNRRVGQLKRMMTDGNITNTSSSDS